MRNFDENLEEKARVHIIVSGRVQGVFFRDFTRRHARQLAVTGWVKNLPNGDVEIVAEGKKKKLLELIEAVKIGPQYAEVTDCKVTWSNYTGEFTDFTIRY
ncbi:MAG: acylphosphatase [candidate division WOR-3 bacterium]|nr:acylphosphatase [candidate division WOR-3 bacterium]